MQASISIFIWYFCSSRSSYRWL